jgi:hypothetical protein
MKCRSLDKKQINASGRLNRLGWITMGEEKSLKLRIKFNRKKGQKKKRSSTERETSWLMKFFR